MSPTATSRAPRPLLLSVEDEPAIIELISTLVEPLGVDLMTASDGREALALLDTVQPSLITLDLVMPGMDGFALLAEMRRRGSLDKVPVVVITGITDAATIRRAYACGASDFIAKPFNVAIVEQKLQTFMRLARLVDEVRERERFLTDVMENLSSGLLVCDGEGRIRRLNPAGASALGLESSLGAVGQLLSDVALGAEAMLNRAPSAEQRRVTVRSTGAASSEQGRATGSGSGPIASPGPTGDRALGYTTAGIAEGGTVTVFRELSASETAHREAGERARHEALARAAASFAHEVSNPLTTIAAAAQIIGRDDADRALQKKLARAVEREAERVRGLVAEYVEQQETRTPLTEVDLAVLLEEVVEVNLLGASARSRVRVLVPPSLPRVRASFGRMKQVVLNLLFNAVAATAAGGEIFLELRSERGGVTLIVRDTGVGIPAAALAHVFDESFSTKPGGKGLGLAIARTIVEEHGGTLRAESHHGQGSSFSVWLRAVTP